MLLYVNISTPVGFSKTSFSPVFITTYCLRFILQSVFWARSWGSFSNKKQIFGSSSAFNQDWWHKGERRFNKDNSWTFKAVWVIINFLFLSKLTGSHYTEGPSLLQQFCDTTSSNQSTDNKWKHIQLQYQWQETLEKVYQNKKIRSNIFHGVPIYRNNSAGGNVSRAI